MKEKVLELKIVKMNEEYSAWCVSYQNEEVLPRGIFEDEELGVSSKGMPRFNNMFGWLYIRGTYDRDDLIVNIIDNCYVSLLERKLDAINEKYGKEEIMKEETLEIERAKKLEFYYFIDYFDPEDLIQKSVECGGLIDDNLYSLKNYFLDKEEAIACEKHLRNEIIKFRKEWKRNKG